MSQVVMEDLSTPPGDSEVRTEKSVLRARGGGGAGGKAAECLLGALLLSHPFVFMALKLLIPGEALFSPTPSGTSD